MEGEREIGKRGRRRKGRISISQFCFQIVDKQAAKINVECAVTYVQQGMKPILKKKEPQLVSISTFRFPFRLLSVYMFTGKTHDVLKS